MEIVHIGRLEAPMLVVIGLLVVVIVLLSYVIYRIEGNQWRISWQLAVHEAGHAVIAWYSRTITAVSKTEISPRFEVPCGHVMAHFDEQMKYRPACLMDRAVVKLAGYLAERSVLGKGRLSPDSHDCIRFEHHIELVSLSCNRDPEALSKKALQRSQKLVETYREDIIRLAKVLRKRRRLNEADIAAILGPRPAH